MKYNKVAYLCDGTGCSEMCANKAKEDWDRYSCHHTTDEAHAKNKCRRSRKMKFVDGTSGAFMEVDPSLHTDCTNKTKIDGGY